MHRGWPRLLAGGLTAGGRDSFAGGPDSFAIGAAQPQEEFPYANESLLCLRHPDSKAIGATRAILSNRETMELALRTEIATVPVADLARRFGTPTYVYDAAMMLRRLGDLAGFDHVRYAQKACSNLAVLDLLRRHGRVGRYGQRGRDSPRPGRRLRGRGRPAADRLYRRHLRRRGAGPVRRARHPRQLRLARHDRSTRQPRPGRAITLRINPGFGHGHSRKTNTGGKASKHGIWHEQIAACLARARALRAGRRRAAHAHRFRHGPEAPFAGLAAMEKAAATVGPSVTSISAGGGLPVPYRPGEQYVDLDAYLALWSAARQRLAERFAHPVSLEIEPGRYLVAESGYLVAEIRAVKQQGPNTFYLLDAGFNNLARPILYGAYHPMSIVPADGRTQPPERDVIVGGPLCESGDIFTQEEGGYVCPAACRRPASATCW